MKKNAEKEVSISFNLSSESDVGRTSVELSKEQWEQLPINLKIEIMKDNLTLNELRQEIKSIKEQQLRL